MGALTWAGESRNSIFSRQSYRKAAAVPDSLKTFVEVDTVPIAVASSDRDGCGHGASSDLAFTVHLGVWGKGTEGKGVSWSWMLMTLFRAAGMNRDELGQAIWRCRGWCTVVVVVVCWVLCWWWRREGQNWGSRKKWPLCVRGTEEMDEMCNCVKGRIEQKKWLMFVWVGQKERNK